VVQAAQTPQPIEPQGNGRRSIERRAEAAERKSIALSSPKPLTHVTRIFPYGIARTRLERAIRDAAQTSRWPTT
jgi:hypothetical protein